MIYLVMFGLFPWEIPEENGLLQAKLHWDLGTHPLAGLEPKQASLSVQDWGTVLTRGTGRVRLARVGRGAWLGKGLGESYQDEIPGTILHGAKDAQDDRHDMQEVGQDGSPLVAQEVKDLPLQCSHLWKRQAEATATLLLDLVEQKTPVIEVTGTVSESSTFPHQKDAGS